MEKLIRVVGDKVSAKFVTFFTKEHVRLHSAWVPKIEIDGELLSIFDEQSESGCVESSTRVEALKVARETRDGLKKRLAERMNTV